MRLPGPGEARGQAERAVFSSGISRSAQRTDGALEMRPMACEGAPATWFLHFLTLPSQQMSGRFKLTHVPPAADDGYGNGNPGNRGSGGCGRKLTEPIASIRVRREATTRFSTSF